MKQIKKFLAELSRIWVSERPNLLAAALAYYGMFSFAPVIYVALSIAGIFIDQFTAANQLYARFAEVFGAERAAQIQDLVSAVAISDNSGSLIISIVSFLALFFAASGLFFQLDHALNQVWRVPPPKKNHAKDMIYKRFLAFVMVIGISLLLVAATLINLIVTWFGHLIGLFIDTGSLPLVWTWIATFTLITFSFGLIYKLIPDVKLKWSDVWPGAVIAALLIMLASTLAAFIVKSGSLGSALQTAGTFALLLMIIYYIAQIFLLGAVITRVYAKMFGSKKESPTN